MPTAVTVPSVDLEKHDDDHEMQEENKRLKERIAKLEKDREILKQATAFWVKELDG